MYKPVTSLVNGALIKDLLDLCNSQFKNPFIQPYAGANFECMFCGITKNKDLSATHLQDCPTVKYNEITEKHKRFIVKI